jgi:hypothetical protein
MPEDAEHPEDPDVFDDVRDGDPDTSGDWDTKVIWKSAVDGRIVSEEFARRHPRTTTSMEVPEHATDIEPEDPADDDPDHADLT